MEALGDAYVGGEVLDIPAFRAYVLEVADQALQGPIVNGWDDEAEELIKIVKIFLRQVQKSSKAKE